MRLRFTFPCGAVLLLLPRWTICRRYVELEGKDAWHVKASLVHQAASSSYALTEVQLGGMLTRHDLSIQQVNLEMQLAFSCDRMLTWHQKQP